jgi:DNA mismatch repair ATPase MutS
VSARIRQLERLIYLFDLHLNQLFAPVAVLLLWGVHLAFAIEGWRLQWGRHVPEWLDAVGEFEALLSLSGFAYEHPDYPYPELVSGSPRIDGRALAHPLLKPGACVPNDVALGGALKVILVSGSNMSGKSTYLRTIGVNVVLAQLGAPVCAASLQLTPMTIGATLRVQDSIQDGISRFYAELRRLKTVADAIDGPVPVLFLLDEILHGTNSHDRQIGAEALVKSFVARGAIGLVTTHDLALTRAADAMGAAAANVHFSDTLDGGELRFDYTMRPGVVDHSNALQLMANLGLLPRDAAE